jgi:DNA-directed RNA polymerase I, II, and III subunit RPABC4
MSTQQTNGTDDLLDAGTAAPGADGRPSAASLADQMGAPVTYRCGDCNARVPLKRDDPVRCVQCGYRVLYKERTTRSVFWASARVVVAAEADCRAGLCSTRRGEDRTRMGTSRDGRKR